MTTPLKPKYSAPQLPPVFIPSFAGGKLASIRKKIDEKQVLIDGGIPVQFLKPLSPSDLVESHAEEEEETDEVPKPPETPAPPPSSHADLLSSSSEKKGKAYSEKGKQEKVPCIFCGRAYPAERMELHQSICANFAKLSSKTPFIVKLGIRQVDGDLDPAVEKEGKGDEEGESLPEEEEDEEEGEEEGDEYYVMLEEDTGENDRKFPGGGNNWTKEHENYMKCLQEAQEKMHDYAAGNFFDIPPPPALFELEADYVQCPNCLRRFAEKYNAYDHLKRCNKNSQRLFPLK